jgi:hypothetical protein
MEPQFVRLDEVRAFELAAGGIVLEGMQALVVDGVAHEFGPLEAYALPGGVEHSAYCGPEGALVLDVFAPVREDYHERWHSEEV